MNTPRERVWQLETEPLVPAGEAERFAGYGANHSACRCRQKPHGWSASTKPPDKRLSGANRKFA